MSNLIAKFDLLATLFMRDTGMWAPGKSIPPECGEPHTQEERARRYEAWYKAQALDSVLEHALRLQDQIDSMDQ